MTNQRVSANEEVRLGQLPLERLYSDWLNARAELDEQISCYTPDEITKEIESRVFEPLYQNIEATEAAIVDAHCQTTTDLAIKLLTVMRIHRETYSEQDMDRLLSDAVSLVDPSVRHKSETT